MSLSRDARANSYYNHPRAVGFLGLDTRHGFKPSKRQKFAPFTRASAVMPPQLRRVITRALGSVLVARPCVTIVVNRALVVLLDLSLQTGFARLRSACR